MCYFIEMYLFGVENDVKKIKKTAFFILKLAIAGAVIYVLAARNPREIADCFRSFDLVWLVPALFFYLLHMQICALRWYRLTHVLNVQLGKFEAVSLTMQGYFFSLVIPGGAIGGDVVKMGVLAKRTPPGARMEGAFTILMDRIVGMIALFVLALILLCFTAPLLLNVRIPGVDIPAEWRFLPVAAIAGICVAGLGASCVIFMHKTVEKIPFCKKFLGIMDDKTHGLVNRLISAADTYKQQWREVLKLCVLSVFGVHLMTVVPFACILCGLGVSFSPLCLVAAVTIGNIIGLIPIFPSGVGGRDVATILILIAGGISAADAKTGQLLYTAIVLFANLLGGLFFLLDPGRKNMKELLAESENE